MAREPKIPTNIATNFLPPPNFLSYVIDSFLVDHYGRKSDVDADELLINVRCYLKTICVATIDFYSEPNVPKAAIHADSKTPQGYSLALTFPIDRAKEVLETLRTSREVMVIVNTAAGLCVVSGDRDVGKQIP